MEKQTTSLARWASFGLALFGCSSQQSAGFEHGSASVVVEASVKDADAAQEDVIVEDEATAEAAGALEMSTCNRVLPTCPTAPPSYERDVAPIIAMQCSVCHFAGSAIARGVYSTYTQLQQGRGSVLDEIFACKMPPAPSPPLTPDQRTTLLTWIECGGPNN